MALAHFVMLSHEFFNKDKDIVLEESALIILNRNSDVCMDNNGMDTKHNRHIVRRLNFVRNGEKLNFNKIGWSEGGL